MKNNKNLSENTVDPNPFSQFSIWYTEHMAAGIAIPESFSLATATSDGKVSVRTVLLKDHGEDGFVFFTNYKSKKGAQLTENVNVAMLFYWPETGRQVRIEGFAEIVTPDYSESYFKTRPRESQLSAWASDQSTLVPDRAHLEKKYEFYNTKFSGKTVERPPHWGGFRIIPSWFEFWKSDDHRLHDRIIYSKKKGSWVISRLAP